MFLLVVGHFCVGVCVPNRFCFWVGLVMFFNSMNLDINNGGHFWSRCCFFGCFFGCWFDALGTDVELGILTMNGKTGKTIAPI